MAAWGHRWGWAGRLALLCVEAACSETPVCWADCPVSITCRRRDGGLCLVRAVAGADKSACGAARVSRACAAGGVAGRVGLWLCLGEPAAVWGHQGVCRFCCCWALLTGLPAHWWLLIGVQMKDTACNNTLTEPVKHGEGQQEGAAADHWLPGWLVCCLLGCRRLQGLSTLSLRCRDMCKPALTVTVVTALTVKPGVGHFKSKAARTGSYAMANA